MSYSLNQHRYRTMKSNQILFIVACDKKLPHISIHYYFAFYRDGNQGSWFDSNIKCWTEANAMFIAYRKITIQNKIIKRIVTPLNLKNELVGCRKMIPYLLQNILHRKGLLFNS